MGKFKSIPDKIKICGEHYDIKYVDECAMDDSVGKTMWRRGSIWIANDLSEEKAQITLLHEILHCINGVVWFSRIPDEIDADKKEELIVEKLDCVLHQVLKENNLFFGDKKS